MTSIKGTSIKCGYCGKILGYYLYDGGFEMFESWTLSGSMVVCPECEEKNTLDRLMKVVPIQVTAKV